MPSNEDGSCIYLKNDRCSIYEDRPDICKISEGYEAFKTEMTREEYYKTNAIRCNQFIDDLNIDASFKIDLTQFGGK